MLDSEEVERFLELSFLLCSDIILFGEFGLASFSLLGRGSGGRGGCRLAAFWRLSSIVINHCRDAMERSSDCEYVPSGWIRERIADSNACANAPRKCDVLGITRLRGCFETPGLGSAFRPPACIGARRSAKITVDRDTLAWFWLLTLVRAAYYYCRTHAATMSPLCTYWNVLYSTVCRLAKDFPA